MINADEGIFCRNEGKSLEDDINEDTFIDINPLEVFDTLFDEDKKISWFRKW